MARSGSGQLHFCSQGQPLSHPQQEAERSAECAGKFFAPDRAARQEIGTDPLPVASEVEDQYRKARGISGSAATQTSICLRVPRNQLDHRTRARSVAALWGSILYL